MHPRNRLLRGACYRDAKRRRARLRAAAAAQLALTGLTGFDLRRIAAAAGSKFDIARYHYRTNTQLLADVAHHHQASLAEHLTEPLREVRILPAANRAAFLAAHIMEALHALSISHRASTVARHADPRIAHDARHCGLWLIDHLAAVIAGDARPTLRDTVLARSLLAMLEYWSLALQPDDGLSRAACAELAASMARGEKRPADVIGNAVKVARIAAGEIDDERDATANAAAQLGKLGGAARARNLTREQRVEIARKAAAVRLGK